MRLTKPLLAFFALFAGLIWGAQAQTVSSAHYATEVTRYGHFALGRPHEYASLTATTDSGRKLTLHLPEDEVFEDLAPRLVKLAPHEPTEILAIVSRRHDGARLVLIRLAGDRLEISAQSAAIGTPMRWLNPVGVVDLDGDGRSEIAVVTTPHIGGNLRVYRREGARLDEIATLGGFSNHVLGSPELGLSLPVSVAGQTRLLVPDTTRRALRTIALQGGRLVELGRCALPAQVVGAIRLVSPTELSVGLSNGPYAVALKSCLPTAVSQNLPMSPLLTPVAQPAPDTVFAVSAQPGL